MTRSLECLPWLCLLIGTLFAKETKLIRSIDCGASGTSNDSLGISWEGDENYISAIGKVKTITVPVGSDLHPSLSTLRFFPTIKKNCYDIPIPVLGGKYLVRAIFYYGNYDGISKAPTFALHFDGNYWDTVETSMDREVVKEVIYNPLKNITLCVARTYNDQTPFISSIEVRSLELDMYTTTSVVNALFYVARRAFGSKETIRYPDDPYDRIWNSYQPADEDDLTSKASDLTWMGDPRAKNNPPDKVMLHAVTPRSDTATNMTLPNPITSPSPVEVYYCIYYAELSAPRDNMRRWFTFEIDGVANAFMHPPYGWAEGKPNTNSSLSSSAVLSWENMIIATLPPFVNAWEFFTIRGVHVAGTDAADVGGLKSLQDRFVQLQPWSGDPCLPVGFSWEWLNCSAGDSPRVTNLHLSGLGLSGPLPDFSIMEALRTIDLSNNSLNGDIPNFLGKLPNLTELNLAFNCFSESLPTSLLEKNNTIILKLRGKDLCITNPVEGGNGSSGKGSSGERGGGKKGALIVGATVGSFVFILLLGSSILLCIRFCKRSPSFSTDVTNDPPTWTQHSKDCLIAENKFAFTYAEIVKMTNHFERFIGKGGTGRVYYGRLQNPNVIEVAVKLLQDSSCHGTKELVSEVRMLMKVHHKNLVSFVGFCEEKMHMAVIYEYMHNGSLKNVLTGNSQISKLLTWKKRLQIALDVATGLQYLHSGCHPAIIHRDVKSANILLNEQLEAKLADFGISKAATTYDETNPTVSGTPGYIDPECYQTLRITAKSDVYSFGVVLFELISGLSAIFTTSDGERVHIVSWASSMLMEGEMDRIIDPRIAGQLNMDSMWRAARLALACCDDKSANRQDMTVVVQQLRDCIELQTLYEGSTDNAQTGASPAHQSSDPPTMSSVEITHPAAR